MTKFKKPLITRIVGNGFKPFPTLIAIVFIFTGTGYSASGPSTLRPALQFSNTGREATKLLGEYPQWFNRIPKGYRERLIERLNKIYSYIPELLTLERQHHLLNFFEFWLDNVAKEGGWSNLDYDTFARSVAFEYAKSVSDMYMHAKVLNALGIDQHNVKRMLDLGSGYWNYAYTLQFTFDVAERFVGIERDYNKIDGYERIVRLWHQLDTTKYKMIRGDFLEVEDLLIQSDERQPFDVILLQNPQTDKYPQEFWDSLPKLLGNQGIMIITIDDGRLGYDGNPELLKNIKTFDVKKFETQRITFQEGIPKKVQAFVIKNKAEPHLEVNQIKVSKSTNKLVIKAPRSCL